MFTGRGGGEAQAVAPLTSGEDVANIIEADLFQRLWEAGKGEATPDARPGEIEEQCGTVYSDALTARPRLLLMYSFKNFRFYPHNVLTVFAHKSSCCV